MPGHEGLSYALGPAGCVTLSKPYASILHLETEDMEGRELPEKFSTIRGAPQ